MSVAVTADFTDVHVKYRFVKEQQGAMKKFKLFRYCLYVCRFGRGEEGVQVRLPTMRSKPQAGKQIPFHRNEISSLGQSTVDV